MGSCDAGPALGWTVLDFWGGGRDIAWRTHFPRERPTLGRALTVGAAAGVIGTLLRAALDPAVQAGVPFIAYYPLLMAASIWGGARGGLVALGISAAAAGLLFLPNPGSARLIALVSFLISGGLIVLGGSALADTIRVLRDREERLQATEAQLRVVAGELAHRNRNALTVLAAIVSQSIRGATTLEEADAVITARLQALAEAQDEVLKAAGGPTPLEALVRRTLAPFGPDRFEVEVRGEPSVEPAAAGALCLVLHELATNAVKYGALAARGTISLRCGDEHGASRLVWEERGGPAVMAPQRRGFGQRLLERALAPHGGVASRRFEPAGVVCEISLPAARPRAAPRERSTRHDAPASTG